MSVYTFAVYQIIMIDQVEAGVPHHGMVDSLMVSAFIEAGT